MPKKGILLFAISILMLSVVILTIILVPAIAYISFDGTYDYSYGFNGPTGWESHNVPSGFIVQNGQIHSNPPALSGSVDANGNARFTGPCPQGDNTAVFTGTIHSNGMGGGNYQCKYGHSGEWFVTVVSGMELPSIPGPGDYSSSAPDIFSYITGLGEFFGATGDNALFLGVGIVAVMAAIVGIAMGTALKKLMGFMGIGKARPSPRPGYHRELGYQVSQPAPPGTTQETLSPIGIGHDSHALEDFGKVGVDSSLPASLNLHATWANGNVTLTWGLPSFDASIYRLDGYIVSVMQYGPGSTSPAKIPISRLQPGSMQWEGPFDQTYKFSTGGDIEGYTVEALLSHTSSTGHAGIFRVGATAYAPPN